MYLLCACDTGQLTSTVRGRQAPRRDPPTGGGGGSGGGRRRARSGCEQSYVAQFVRAAPQLSQRPWHSMVLGRRSPRGHRRAAPKVRPRAQHCPGLGEVPSPPWRRREAAAARSACPKSPMSVRLAFRRRRLLPEADAACVPLALTRTLGCRPTTGRVCSIAVVSTAPRWRMRAALAAPPVMGYVVHTVVHDCFWRR